MPFLKKYKKKQTKKKQTKKKQTKKNKRMSRKLENKAKGVKENKIRYNELKMKCGVEKWKQASCSQHERLEYLRLKGEDGLTSEELDEVLAQLLKSSSNVKAKSKSKKSKSKSKKSKSNSVSSLEFDKLLDVYGLSNTT